MASGETVTNAQQFIEIKGAKMHNLKNVDVKIPHNSLVVVTGVSGSGKSSLAFDTLYAEGQRRYVESLSSYARQFLGKLHKPKVDFIKGIAPAIAIEQKVNATNPRSTVGTSTEIYDYIKLLYARIGTTYSPISGKKVKKDTVSDVVNFIKEFEEQTKLLLLAPISINENRDLKTLLQVLEQQGYARLKWNEEIYRISDFPQESFKNEGLYLNSNKGQTEIANAISLAVLKYRNDFFKNLSTSSTYNESSNNNLFYFDALGCKLPHHRMLSSEKLSIRLVNE